MEVPPFIGVCMGCKIARCFFFAADADGN